MKIQVIFERETTEPEEPETVWLTIKERILLPTHSPAVITLTKRQAGLLAGEIAESLLGDWLSGTLIDEPLRSEIQQAISKLKKLKKEGNFQVKGHQQ